jgi:mannosyl-oligosaccharide alpha-1,2-mannosidase
MHCGTDRRWGTCTSLRAVLKPETYRNELPFCVAQRNHPSYFPVPRQDLTTSTTLLMLQRQAMFFRRHRWPIFIIVAVVFIATIAPLSFRFVPSRSPIYPVNDHKYSAPSNTASTSSFGGSHACPTTPPTQAIIPDTQGRFNWRTIPKHNPIDQYSQLPLGKSSPRPSIQPTFGAAASQAKNEIGSRKEAVREVFERCWKSYKDRAWTKDELAPISGGARDTFGSWGATLVDSLDTLWIV